MGFTELLPIASYLGLFAAVAWWVVYAYGSDPASKDADHEPTQEQPRLALPPRLPYASARDEEEATAIFSDKLLGEDAAGVLIDRD